MKRLVGVAAMAVFAMATMGQDGCATKEDSGGPTVKQQGDKKRKKRKAQATPEKPASIGDTITLEGLEKEKIAVKLLGVTDPVVAGEYDTAPSGGRFVGVRLEIENVGSVPYSDSPSNGMVLVLSGD